MYVCRHRGIVDQWLLLSSDLNFQAADWTVVSKGKKKKNNNNQTGVYCLFTLVQNTDLFPGWELKPLSCCRWVLHHSMTFDLLRWQKLYIRVTKALEPGLLTLGVFFVCGYWSFDFFFYFFSGKSWSVCLSWLCVCVRARFLCFVWKSWRP